MIQIDRNSPVPIHAQLSSRLRFLIASGHFSPGDFLPSTRTLARQLDISFHTVRRAYDALEKEKYLEARQGAGYEVTNFDPPSKSARMEQGASVVHGALQQLVGLGLDEQEIDYLIQEQSSILESEDADYKLILIGPFREWSDRNARVLSDALQRTVVSVVTSEIHQHADADFVIVPFRMLRSTLGQVPDADVIGIQSHLGAEALSMTARLLERETLGLVTGRADAIGPLTSDIRGQTKFSGQILAASVEHGDSHLEPVLRQSELVLYTEAAWRSLKPSISKTRRYSELTFELADSSIRRLRELIPG